jgi:hypothetical protein
MRSTWRLTASLLALGALAFAGSALAIPEGWHKSMEDGLEAAAKSGKPLLVVTGWKDGV